MFVTPSLARSLSGAARVLGLAMLLSAALLAASPVRASTPTLTPEKANPVTIPFVETGPVIDGKLDDAVWERAAVLKDFVQTDPGDNTPPTAPTEVMLAYDAKTLYVAYRCHQDPATVRTSLSRREAFFGSDDYVVFYLDTFDDKRRAFVFVLNPNGIQGDGIFTESRGEDYNVDLVWSSKGTPTPDGYTVEAAIPFKSLRYEAGEGKMWNAHFYRRLQYANRELDSWMPFKRGNSSNLAQAGRLTGLDRIDTEHTLELTPSLTVSETGQRVRGAYFGQLAVDPVLVDRGRFVNKPVGVDPGLNVKYGLTPAITLDLAFNPDFAQVEADAPVVTANQRFPIFFAEKRTFFLEGIDYFQTPLTPVHTRTIIDPDFAVKLTGKRGPYTFGLLGASDNAPGSFSKEERAARIIDHNALVGVLRLKRDLGVENSLGVIATSYDFVDRHNKTAGFDGRFKLDQSTTVEFRLLGTSSRRYLYEPTLDAVDYRRRRAFVVEAPLLHLRQHGALEAVLDRLPARDA